MKIQSPSKPLKHWFALFLLGLSSSLEAVDPIFNREPLQASPYAELPLGAIRAEGWLHDELERMAQGMTGHLDVWYPEVCGPRNAWLGGDGDTWERGPYWIDGLYPLARLLGDEALLNKAMTWIEWTLATGRLEEGLAAGQDLEDLGGLRAGSVLSQPAAHGTVGIVSAEHRGKSFHFRQHPGFHPPGLGFLTGEHLDFQGGSHHILVVKPEFQGRIRGGAVRSGHPDHPRQAKPPLGKGLFHEHVSKGLQPGNLEVVPVLLLFHPTSCQMGLIPALCPEIARALRKRSR